MENNIKLGVTLGDPNGIGPEIILKTFSDPKILSEFIVIIYSPIEIISFYIENYKFSINYKLIKSISQAKKGRINIFSINSDPIKVSPGNSNFQSGAVALKSLNAATNDVIKKHTDCIVTAPIDKKTIQSKNFTFKGHTEFLTRISNREISLMIMVNSSLRIGLVTNHIAINKISNAINAENLLIKIKLICNSLQNDFKISKPRIAILGLNPHSGDQGLIGKEELKVIIPALNKANNNEFNIFGPFSADGFFSSKSYKNYDGILAMYHDQGLIPFKLISNNKGVNFTAGLPFVRTSPAHGTAYDIAGKNKANHSSFKNAVYLARQIYLRRRALK